LDNFAPNNNSPKYFESSRIFAVLLDKFIIFTLAQFTTQNSCKSYKTKCLVFQKHLQASSKF